MKLIQIASIVCVIALITTTAVSAMENNGLYSNKEDAKYALYVARSSGTCTSNSCIFEELKKSHPDKKVDLWKCGSSGSAVSVYYTDSSASKGYKAIYQDGSTQNSFLTCGDKGTIDESYKPYENTDSNVGDQKSSNNEKSSSNEEKLSISDTVKENIKEQITEGIMDDIEEKIKETRSISLKDLKEIINNRIPDEIVINGKN
jgi:Na+-transporting NADH:ubiquinone oxidoreductase subunit NqrF